LPYFHACMSSKSGRRNCVFLSAQHDAPRWKETLQASYIARVCSLRPSAEHGIFSDERYCLYAQNPVANYCAARFTMRRGLQEARATLMANTMLEQWKIAIWVCRWYCIIQNCRK
jgi:hypothetical protein